LLSLKTVLAFISAVGVPAFATAQTNPTSQATTLRWPSKEGTVTLSNFHFGSGETLPELRLHYYDDMVRSQRMMLDDMHVDHLRLILGTSMGCMQSFVWGETYPDFMDALAPFACLPVEIASRNRMMRYMAIEDLKLDPAWQNGEYMAEPQDGLRGTERIASRDGIRTPRDAEAGSHPREGRRIR